MDSVLTYSYLKLRKNFGKQPLFCETPPALLDSIDPDLSLQREYCLRNPVNNQTQTSITLSKQYMNTIRVTLQDRGVNHAEGGWPKDVNVNDEEATARYRRRFERDDAYVGAVLSSNPYFEHLIHQNNAIEMYNMYFKEMKPQKPVETYSVKIKNAYKDLFQRPVASIAWTFEANSKLVVSHCYKKMLLGKPLNTRLEGNVWDLENANEPAEQFLSPTACWQIVCSPSHPKVMMGGLEDGRVCIFDLREKIEPVRFSMMHLAHRDPVSALLFLHSRLNTEFFSGSSDGKCMWWDIRNISEPVDSLIMSINPTSQDFVSMADAEGISCLQFDKTFPTKFLCGTDTGLVINVNRKGKTHQEIMSAIFNAHYGPVKALYRSPCTTKVFITCGDWTVNIWSDDVHCSPIICGKAHRMQISDVSWSPQKMSGYMSISYDGKFRYWDLLRRHYGAIVTKPVSKFPLLRLKPNKQGKFVAVGDTQGIVNLLSLSDSLVISDNKDKTLMNQTFEREGRREHILETRIKEIRLKLREVETGVDSDIDLMDENVIKTAEDEFKRVVTEELKRSGTTHISSGKRYPMRNR
ncbi:dynein axonemal intermediate chain 2-like [Danaus plexippus]|uniref:dynein axonemal intermediate chain 2-like n=1 Tax=Danaus plexippus TaxID=13037 RepID=UPI002AB138A5|nr:dynein axonemal intermediate chain 2-like [Danaus plexippus]